MACRRIPQLSPDHLDRSVRVQLLLDNKTKEAFDTVKMALDHVVETGEAILAAELHRLNGIIALAGESGRDEHLAEQAFKTAIEVAGQQDAKLLELRASTSLARLWCDQGKLSDGEHLLASLYNCFTEGLVHPICCRPRFFWTSVERALQPDREPLRTSVRRDRQTTMLDTLRRFGSRLTSSS